MRAGGRGGVRGGVGTPAGFRLLRQMGIPAILLVVLVVLPIVLPYEALATQILVFALFSLGFDLLYGHTGLLSFGHAAFFGLGAYGAGLAARATQGNVLLAIVAAAVMAWTGAAVIGFLSLRRRGVYFALITLAFAQLLYFTALQWRTLTGGDDGLRGLPVMALRVGGTVLAELRSSHTVYVLTAIVVWIAFLLMRRLHESPFGRALVAVRENERRAEASGYNTSALKWWAFVLSGTLCGVAGALNTLLLHFVGLDVLSWLTSGFVVLMTMLGGAGTLLGPFVGAGLFVALQDVVSTVPAIADSWPLVVGIMFIIAVLLFPKGVWGTVLAIVRESEAPADTLPEWDRQARAPARNGAPTAGAPIHVESVIKRFGALTAVNGVSLDIAPGRVLGIIGPNGAGKSTLLRLIAGEMAPTSGRISVGDREITGWPLYRVARAGVIKSFQITSIFPNLTTFENVRVATLARRNPYVFWKRADGLRDVAAQVDHMLQRVHLAGKRGYPAYALSHGEQRHLEIAIALAAEPHVLLLDEPTAGMSPEETRKIVVLIQALAADLTIVVVEHKMDVIRTVCKQVAVMHFGSVLAEGAPEQISALDTVQAVYLGRP